MVEDLRRTSPSLQRCCNFVDMFGAHEPPSRMENSWRGNQVVAILYMPIWKKMFVTYVSMIIAGTLGRPRISVACDHRREQSRGACASKLVAKNTNIGSNEAKTALLGLWFAPGKRTTSGV